MSAHCLSTSKLVFDTAGDIYHTVFDHVCWRHRRERLSGNPGISDGQGITSFEDSKP